jgi:hypothetical protein
MVSDYNEQLELMSDFDKVIHALNEGSISPADYFVAVGKVLLFIPLSNAGSSRGNIPPG